MQNVLCKLLVVFHVHVPFKEVLNARGSSVLCGRRPLSSPPSLSQCGRRPRPSRAEPSVQLRSDGECRARRHRPAPVAMVTMLLLQEGTSEEEMHESSPKNAHLQSVWFPSQPIFRIGPNRFTCNSLFPVMSVSLRVSQHPPLCLRRGDGEGRCINQSPRT